MIHVSGGARGPTRARSGTRASLLRLPGRRIGLLFFVLTALVGATAVNSGSNPTHLLFGSMLGAIFISGMLALLSLVGLKAERSLPRRIFAKTPFRAEVLLTNRKRLVPSFSVTARDSLPSSGLIVRSSCYALYLPSGRAATLHYIAQCQDRGRQRMGRFRLSSAFPFSFFRNFALAGKPEDFIVYPEIGHIRSKLPEPAAAFYLREGEQHSRRAGQDEFFGLAEYRPGDNPKWIHWRTSARFDQLMVRQFLRPAERRFSIILDSFPPDGSAESSQHFEAAISFAATALRQWVAAGYEASLVLPGHAEPIRCRSLGPDYDRALKELALLQPTRLGFGSQRFLTDDASFAVLVVSQPGRGESAEMREIRGRYRGTWLVDTRDPDFDSLFSLPSTRGLAR